MKRIRCWLGFHEYHRVRQLDGPIAHAGIHIYSRPYCWYCGHQDRERGKGR